MVAGIGKKLISYGAEGLVVVGVHGKFVGKWEENINDPSIKKIFVTDSREPIGNIPPYVKSGKIEILSLQGLIYQILEADKRGVNFWEDPEYQHLIL